VLKAWRGSPRCCFLSLLRRAFRGFAPERIAKSPTLSLVTRLPDGYSARFLKQNNGIPLWSHNCTV
jgi:hypothetical protein